MADLVGWAGRPLLHLKYNNDIYGWNGYYLEVENTTIPAGQTAKISKDITLTKGNWIVLSTRGMMVEVNGNGQLRINNTNVAFSANGYSFFEVLNISGVSATLNVYLQNWSGAAISVQKGDTNYKYWSIIKI